MENGLMENPVFANHIAAVHMQIMVMWNVQLSILCYPTDAGMAWSFANNTQVALQCVQTTPSATRNAKPLIASNQKPLGWSSE